MSLAELLVTLDGIEDFQREALFGVGHSVHLVNTIPEKPNRSRLREGFQKNY
jgi:hypothetical protein